MALVFDPLDPHQPTLQFLHGQNGPVPNKYYDPALAWWEHHGRYQHGPLEARLRNLIRQQKPAPFHSSIEGRRPHSAIHTSLTPPGGIHEGPKLLLFPGHLNVQPYNGQGSDQVIAFMQYILDFRDQHGLQIRQLYEILVSGLGGFLLWWTTTIDSLLRSIPNPRTRPPNGQERGWYLNWVGEMNQEACHVHRPH